MGFYKVDYEILDFLKKDGMHTDSVLEFGSQDKREDRHGHAIAQRISAQEVYKEYGFSYYRCIDIDNAYECCLPYDLGQNLREHYGFNEVFDVVTIKEIGHWIFDQKTLFENIHNCTKGNGYIIWRSPIVGGFSAGCFAYMPNKMLQLCFCNDYLYKGAWIYEEFLGQNAKFGRYNQGNVVKIGEYSAKNFLNDIEKYYEHTNSYRFSHSLYGEYLCRLTMVFQKPAGGGGKFIAPFFPYVSAKEAIVRNAKSVLKNCLPKVVDNRIAIFGTKQAAFLAFCFARACSLNILCFIDDYNEDAFYMGKPIVKWEQFVHLCNQCDFILCGPYQKGDLSRADNIIFVATLDMRWFY